MDSLASLKRYAQLSPAPVCASETLAGRWAFRDLLETGAAGVVMLDISWCGGIWKRERLQQWRRRGTYLLLRTTAQVRLFLPLRLTSR